MLKIEASLEPEHRNEGHDHWLAMRSAYLEYRQASDALECTRGSAEELSSGERLQMTLLEGQQRVTFERYLEARIEFMEFHCDEIRRSATGFSDPDAVTPPRPIAKFRPLLEALAVVLLCTTAFSLALEQRHVRDLETSRDQLQVALKQTRNGLQLLGQKVDSIGDLQRSPIQHARNTPQTSPATFNRTLHKPGYVKDAKRQAFSSAPQKQALASSLPAPSTQRSAIPRSYSFSLTPSRRSTKLGPIEVSVRSVNPRQNTISLTLVSGSLKLDLPDLKPNEPVSFNRGPQQHRMELTIDRLDGKQLEGHLLDYTANNSEPKANRLRPEYQMGPQPYLAQ